MESGNRQSIYSTSRPWKIAISNPRKENSQSYLGILTIEGNAFISTSDDYEKYVIEDGVRYHHILNTQTGFPADSGLISVTIVCDEGWLSDGCMKYLYKAMRVTET